MFTFMWGLIVSEPGLWASAFHDEAFVRRTMRVASEPDYPPFCIVNESGKADGFSIDLLRAVASEMKFKLSIQVGPWNRIKQELAAGKLDILPMVGRSKEREDYFDFTFPYHTMRGAIFVRKGEKGIRKLSDLNSRSIAVMAGDNAHEFILSRKLGGKVHTTETFKGAFRMLSKGSCEAVISQRLLGLNLINEMGIKNIQPLKLDLKGFNQDFGFAVREGDKALLSVLNEGLSIVIANGTYDRLHQKWWSPIQQRELSFYRKLILLTPYLVGILILSILGVSFFLKIQLNKKSRSLEAEIEQKLETKARLERNRERHRLFLKNAMDGFLVFERSGRIVEVNEAYARMSGFPANSLLEMHIFDLEADKTRLQTEQLLAKVVEKGSVRIHSRHRRENGKLIDVEMTIQHQPAEEIFVAFLNDITERREADLALRESEEKFRSLFDNMKGGFALHKMVFDKDGTPADYIFLEVNRAFEKQTGLKKTDIIGKKVTEILPGIKSDPADWINMYGRVVTTGQSIVFENYAEPIRKWYSVVAFRPGEGEFAVIIHDITDEKELELEKKKLKSQLAQAQKMEAIGTLAGGIAHDFNNILGVIMGYTDLSLEEENLSSDMKINLDQIMTASERAKEMVQQILAFSRKSDLTMGPVQVGRIIKEAVLFLRSSIPTTIRIKYDIQKNLKAIYGNATQINQILLNLCTNASHSMKENGGEMTISLSELDIEKDNLSLAGLPNGRYQKLSVSDTGCGISDSIIDRIFEPYFTTKKEGEGTGMGLAVIYGIVKQHGGDVKVYSEVGKGTVFNVYLPVIDAVQLNDAAPESEVYPMGNRERVMLVDDEQVLIDIGSKMLRQLNYLVEQQNSSIEALAAFKQDPLRYDLVITDMTMPDMTGLQLAKSIHEIRPDLPIILCTGFSDGINRETLFQYGISDLVMKPIVKKNLIQSIRKVLAYPLEQEI